MVTRILKNHNKFDEIATVAERSLLFLIQCSSFFPKILNAGSYNLVLPRSTDRNRFLQIAIT